MRIPALIFGFLLVSCGSEQKTAAPPPQQTETPKPSDESRRFPKANLVETKVVDNQIMGKPFMPGGTLGRYQKGTGEYEVFVAKLPTALDAAVLLPDWRHALTDSKVEASFGGYFGQDAGKPVFVFCKGVWIAGIVGLSEKDADQQARILATHLN